MTKYQRIQQFATDNNCAVEFDDFDNCYILKTQETKKVYNWDGFEVEPVATYHFQLEGKGGEIASPDVYGLTAKSYKTDSGFMKAVDRLQADIDACAA